VSAGVSSEPWPGAPTYEEVLAFLLSLVGSDVTVLVGAEPGGGLPCVAELYGALRRAEQHWYVDELDESYFGTEVLEFSVGDSGAFVVAERDFGASEWVTSAKNVVAFHLGPVSIMVDPTLRTRSTD